MFYGTYRQMATAAAVTTIEATVTVKPSMAKKKRERRKRKMLEKLAIQAGGHLGDGDTATGDGVGEEPMSLEEEGE